MTASPARDAMSTNVEAGIIVLAPARDIVSWMIPWRRVAAPPFSTESTMTTKLSLAAALAAALVLAIPTSVNAHNHGKADSAASAETTQTIVGIAAGNPDFSTLVAALKAADLVATLDGAGPFTVFAPTNAAFEKLPAGTVENLLKPENKAQLTAVLTYHVVAGSVLAADVVKLTEATTVEGSKVAIKVADGKVMLNGAATVTATDIKGSNGVIHVIDSVILPPAKN
jgi:uncharacterized surface protein with fasciclin (FAS1) repeats